MKIYFRIFGVCLVFLLIVFLCQHYRSRDDTEAQRLDRLRSGRYMMGLNNDLSKTICLENYKSLDDNYIGALKAEQELMHEGHGFSTPSTLL